MHGNNLLQGLNLSSHRCSTIVPLNCIFEDQKIPYKPILNHNSLQIEIKLSHREHSSIYQSILIKVYHPSQNFENVYFCHMAMSNMIRILDLFSVFQ
jgi:hypothetical protein